MEPRCPDLVDLDVAEDADEVHHGGVELETQVGRADVVADAEKPLEHQREAQALKSYILSQKQLIERALIVFGALALLIGLDVFDQHFHASVHFPQTSAVNKSQQH